MSSEASKHEHWLECPHCGCPVKAPDSFDADGAALYGESDGTCSDCKAMWHVVIDDAVGEDHTAEIDWSGEFAADPSTREPHEEKGNG